MESLQVGHTFGAVFGSSRRQEDLDGWGEEECGEKACLGLEEGWLDSEEGAQSKQVSKHENVATGSLGCGLTAQLSLAL